MDEFAERVAAVPMDVSDVPAVLFADDVLLTAKITTGAAVAFGNSNTVGG